MVFPDQYTVAFLKKMTRDFYPQLTLSGQDLDEKQGAAILEDICEKKPYLCKCKGYEDNEDSSQATCKQHVTRNTKPRSKIRNFNIPWLKMSGFIREGKFVVEMLLCNAARTAFILQGPVLWYDKDDKEGYRCMAPDPSTFPRRYVTGKSDVPMKYINEDPEDHSVAAEWFVRALNSGIVSGTPRYLLQASMPIENFHYHLAQ